MSLKKLIRTEAFPAGWCPGCGLHVLFHSLCGVLDNLNLGKAIIVSGIGCTGRGAGYFNLDSVHGLHGRAIPLAVGIKKANPKLKVVVFSGDGDLLGIGGNHFLHSARRNDEITVICNSNEVFGMTGGQASPTTALGGITKTTPGGNTVPPIDVQATLRANKKYFYARSSPFFKDHLEKCLTTALQHKGFAFVEVISPCLVNYARKNGHDLASLSKEIKSKYEVHQKNGLLKDNQLGMVKK